MSEEYTGRIIVKAVLSGTNTPMPQETKERYAALAMSMLGELQFYRHNNLNAEVAPHVVYATAASRGVGVEILQSAEVALVGAVGEVLAR